MLLSGALWRGLDTVHGLQRLDAFREFRNARPLLFSRLMRRTGKSGLELVTQAGQFGQVGVVEERLAKACLVIAEL